MKIILAPMEGVIDSGMRDLLTSLGGYDKCVTEFIRVNEQILPDRVFLRYCPELEQGGTTSSGVPVILQLLGGSPKFMALNAARAQKLNPKGIDINFGCPSKTVTRHNGGSALLLEPERIRDIVTAVRNAVDPSIPVTAKIRLGFSHHDYLDKISNYIADAGASELCIHARTRDDRYKPPAYWSAVKTISTSLSIPVIINGEIWSVDDARNAQIQSGCTDIMLGRGALTCPDIAHAIYANCNGEATNLKSWSEVLEMVTSYLMNSKNKHPKFISNRLKQWLVFLQRNYPQAKDLFHSVKRLKVAEEIFRTVDSHQQTITS